MLTTKRGEVLIIRETYQILYFRTSYLEKGTPPSKGLSKLPIKFLGDKIGPKNCFFLGTSYR